MGGNHEELKLKELLNLESEMEQALEKIRNRKELVITNRTQNLRKKVRGMEQLNRHLNLELETRFLAHSNDNGGEYEDAAVYANRGAAEFLSMSNHHPFHYNLQQHGDSLGYRNLHDLRLA